MPPIIRLPNARPGHPRLTINHLKRLKNSMNRQGALYGAGNNNAYNGAAALREMNMRRNIALEVGMTQREIAPYYHKYLNLQAANNRRPNRPLQGRVNRRVRSAARRFLVRPRMSAMRGQLRNMNVRTGSRTATVPIEIRNLIASAMLRR
jgi:hypothetical protein